MKKTIFITEECDEGSGGNLYDYDSLPAPVKTAVDEALKDEYQTYECDIYKQGLQFLFQYEKQNQVSCKIPDKETVFYMGNVTLIHR